MIDLRNWQSLANAIILQASEDYRVVLRCLKAMSGHRKALAYKDEIESFFRSDWFMILTAVDGEMLIHSLTAEVGE